MKTSFAKDKEKEEGQGHRSSRASVYTPDKDRRSRRMSSVSMSGHQTSMAFRSDGKGFKMPKYQNTYRLEPYVLFDCNVSDKILAQIMTARFEDVHYDPETAVTLCSSVSKEIRDKLYRTVFERVKYVVIITLVENSDQSLDIRNARLWDSDRDTYSVYVFESPRIFATGFVAAVNYE